MCENENYRTTVIWGVSKALIFLFYYFFTIQYTAA